MTVLTPGVSFDLDQLQTSLLPTGWLLTAPDPQWQQATLTKLLGQLPPDVQAQLRGADQLLIQVDRSTWGIVSPERKPCVLVRLVQPDGDLASMKSAAAAVAQRLPSALGGGMGGGGCIDLTDTIWIRSNNTGETLAQGSIVSHRTLRFGAYLTQERRREARWLRYAAVLTVLFAAGGISIHLLDWTGTGALQAQGYLERIASGLFVASLMLLVNLQFEFMSMVILMSPVLASCMSPLDAGFSAGRWSLLPVGSGVFHVVGFDLPRVSRTVVPTLLRR